MSLTPRRIRFCVEYVKSRNAVQAYVNAGFSEKSAAQGVSRLLQDVEVREEIAKRTKAGVEFSDLTVAEVINGIREVTLLAKADENWQAALKGLELEGRYLAMFTEKRELSGKNGGPIQVDATVRQGVLTAEEREALKTKLKGILD